MKFCGQCGSKLEDSAIFCNSCGAKQETDGKAKTPVNVQKKKNKKAPAWIGLGLVAVVAVVILSAIVRKNMSYTTIDLKDYVEVSFSGFETMGEADVKVSDDLSKDLNKLYQAFKANNSTEAFQKTAQKIEELKAEKSLSSMFDREISLLPESGLSNGDKVEVSVSMDHEIWKLLKVKIKDYEGTVKVKGLKDIVEVSAEEMFSGAEVKITGISPFLHVSVSNTSSDPLISRLRYMVAGQSTIAAVGDTVMIGISNDSIAEKLLKEGYVVDVSLQKEYAVKNADRYVADWDEVPEEMQKKLLENAVICGEKKLAEVGWFSAGWEVYDGTLHGYIDNEECTALTVDRVYTLLGTSEYYQNKMIIILAGECTSKENAEWKKVCYFPVEVCNIILRENGVCEADINWMSAVNTGNTDISMLYKQYISEQKERYNATETILTKK